MIASIRRQPIRAIASLIAASLIVTVAVLWSYVTWSGKFGPFLGDVSAYWEAALRLRGGAPLYPQFPDTSAAAVYRYSPWFAYAWVPITYLPRPLVEAGWVSILAAAGFYSVRHLLNRKDLLVAIFLGATLAMGIQAGNVHPLLIALLVASVGTRLGPVGIAVAASLKAFPLLLALVYVGRGDWKRFSLTIVLTALLVSPLMLHDLREYTVDPERTLSLISLSPVLWAGVALASSLVALRLSRTRYAWLAAAVAVLTALPRLILYDFSYLLVATRRIPRTGTDTGGNI